MEIIKKKILASDLLKGNVHMKIQLNQKIDDLGISSDMPYGSFTQPIERDMYIRGGSFQKKILFWCARSKCM